ncbi:MAG TPA: hypothetical protein VLE53_05030, partial [Gemmatimonadaceae bacterium]|nr:hypothetical protein [Gemmatimonadaceae bacterium]
VQYEETPFFTTVPTNIAGLTTEWALPFGAVSLTAISQRQRTTFTRPPLGYEPQGSLVAGLGASLGWNLPGFSQRLARVLSAADGTAPSRLDVRAELAVSRPQQSASQQAYLESFEGGGEVSVNLLESQWQPSSQPALGIRLPERVGAQTLDTTRAATMVFQNHGSDASGQPVTFSIQQIDPLTRLPGGTLAGFEQMLWLTLYPLRVGGLRDAQTNRYRWTVGNAPTGRRWRSVRTPLGAGGNGVDLTRAEHLEFWTLADTSVARRGRNPVLVFDFGTVSENSVAFAPESLRIVNADSIWTGKKLQGWDRMNTERDRFSRAFSAEVNDLGLPGDVVDTLHMLRDGVPVIASNFPICRLEFGRLLPLGDSRINCTRRNSRLDEEDIDQDAVLNLTSAERELERVRRFIIDLSDTTSYNRIGTCDVRVNDINGAFPAGSELCWVQVRVPFNAPDDSTGGGPQLRRVRALRVTVISGANAPENHFTLMPLARLRVVGAGWLKRASRPLVGLGGEQQTLGGFVAATVIGTADRDSTRGLVYEPPPGVTDEPELAGTPFGITGAPINERSMRLLTGDLPRYGRAEAYLRFPEGDRNMMSYRELRVWARGRGRGWGAGGDLEFFIKLGRDANNFYAYRTPVNAGNSRAAWEPEIRVRFSRFYALRARLQSAVLAGQAGFSGCSAADSALILASGLPMHARAAHHAACEDGYVVYTVDPAVTPPNLAAVQELATGILRVDSLAGTDPPMLGDTLEVWVDDIRLADAVQATGYAGYIEASLIAGDVGSIRLQATRRDPNFRQLGERPSFLTNEDLAIAATWRLEKLLPWRLGITAPMTVTHTLAAADPLFLSGADILGGSVDDLRSPQLTNTTAALSIRRATPLTGSWLAPFLNHLGFTAAWNGGGAQSEYQRSRTNGLDVGLDYLFANGGPPPAPPPGAPVPGAPPSSTRAPPGVELSPSLIRVSSAFVRGTDRVDAFVTPALLPADSARRTGTDQQLWRNVTTLEFRPVPSVTARWDMATTRDLREYGVGSPNAIAAGQERASVAGIDLGLERERNLSGSVLYAPASDQWIRPRVELTSGYSLLRDPNAPAVRDPQSEDVQRLARRFGNSQRASVSAAFDLPRAAQGRADSGSIVDAIARALGTVDVTLSRDQITSYDAAPLTPSLGYQLGFGGIDAFREIRDVLAASAGAGTGVVVTNTLTLPFGVAISNRVQRGDTRHWSRRQQERETLIDGTQLVFPDVALRWTGRPTGLGELFSNVSATARAVHSRQAFRSPSDIATNPDETRATLLRTYPFSLNLLSAGGDLSLAATFTRHDRVDSLPGSVGESRTSELSADVTRAFPLPRSWDLQSGLRTRVSYQEAETRSYVSNLAAIGLRSRLTDNGRKAFTVSADTDLQENVTFSLQGSRVVTFDRNFNRRFTQTVISAVLNIQFFGGALR